MKKILMMALCLLLISGCKPKQIDQPTTTEPSDTSVIDASTSDTSDTSDTSVVKEVSLSEVLDKDSVEYLNELDKKKKVVLSYYGSHGDEEEYNVTDMKKINAFKEALMNLQIGGIVEEAPTDNNDMFVFSDDSEGICALTFNEKHLIVNSTYYYVSNDEALWKLVKELTKE